MILKDIRLVNWKCFEDKTITFDNKNIINWTNGSGKSSLIEAIVFAFTDKRPNGLSFDNLRNDLTKDCKITLNFIYNLKEYTIKRKFGSASVFEIYEDGQLFCKSKKDNQDFLNKVFPEYIVNNLWGYKSLAESEVLKTDFLFSLLENQFSEPLLYKDYFTKDRTFHQKSIKTIESVLSDKLETKTLDKDIKDLEDKINNIKSKLKDKTLISNDEIVKAKTAKQDYQKYQELLNKLKEFNNDYDKDTVKLIFGLMKPTLQSDIDNYIKNNIKDITNQLNEEQSKASKVHPLAKYPKDIVDKMIQESETNNKCIFCGDDYTPIKIDYNLVDSNKIDELNKKLDYYKDLESKHFDINKYKDSYNYYLCESEIEKVEYSKDIDFEKILNEYNEETNNLYKELDELEEKYNNLNKDRLKLDELLQHKKDYDTDKVCIDITKEFIENLKKYYSDNILKLANDRLYYINTRYTNLCIKENNYFVNVEPIDSNISKQLPVLSLSAGEKTIIALSLILSIRDLFFKDMFLIFDESFVNLDLENIKQVEKIIKQDTSQWLLVSHDDRLRII